MQLYMRTPHSNTVDLGQSFKSADQLVIPLFMGLEIGIPEG
jgi:hypothetical protein